MKWVVGAMVASVLALGCDEGAGEGRGSAGPGAGGKADDAEAVEIDPEAQAQHIEAVVGCESVARRDRENTSALRHLERTDIESARLRCLSDANDATRSYAALSLEVTAPEQAAKVGDVFDQWRSGHSLLCSALIDAHENALEKSISATEAACVAESELRLAEAIEAFVDLGGERTTPPEQSARYTSCYEDFEAALEAGDLPADEPADTPGDAPADTTDGADTAEGADMTEGADTTDDALDATTVATQTLADCLEAELEGSIETLATRVFASFPGRDADRIRETFEQRYEDASEIALEVCDVLAYASADASELQVHRCRASAAIWRHEVIGHVIPAAGPDADVVDPQPPGDDDGDGE